LTWENLRIKACDGVLKASREGFYTVVLPSPTLILTTFTATVVPIWKPSTLRLKALFFSVFSAVGRNSFGLNRIDETFGIVEAVTSSEGDTELPETSH
jgi:hypothetical protein